MAELPEGFVIERRGNCASLMAGAERLMGIRWVEGHEPSEQELQALFCEWVNCQSAQEKTTG
jgi:hypothetical protein